MRAALRKGFLSKAAAVIGIFLLVATSTRAEEVMFIDGDKVVGVMVRSDVAQSPKVEAIGFISIRIGARAVYEGVYNLKKDGSAWIGAIWPEGLIKSADISGHFELKRVAGGGARGVLTMTDGVRHRIQAR